VPVVSGYAARPFADMPVELARALVSPVRWRETMAALVQMGARRFVDVGPGEVLARLVKRNVPIEQGNVVVA
jgi:[acyl-carrier-protein] S-malonyltransferase